MEWGIFGDLGWLDRLSGFVHPEVPFHLSPDQRNLFLELGKRMLSFLFPLLFPCPWLLFKPFSLYPKSSPCLAFWDLGDRCQKDCPSVPLPLWQQIYGFDSGQGLGKWQAIEEGNTEKLGLYLKYIILSYRLLFEECKLGREEEK